MKKLSILLALILILTCGVFTACSEDADTGSTESVESTESTTSTTADTSDASSESGDASSESGDASSESSDASSESSDASSESGDASSDDKKVQRGTIDGNVYKSEYSGITFTKPDGWVYSSDEEIAKTMNIGAEMLDKDKFEQAVANAATTYDMMVKEPTTNTNVIISYENLAATNNENITIDEYTDAVIAQLENQNIIEYVFSEPEDIELSGETYFSVIASASYNGIEVTQAYYMRKIDSIIVGVIVTTTETTLAEIEAMFS